ncbi:MAG: hypothetical protein KAV43_03265 [Hadesarchaea archaeon]|nr:hypothetical protein [Hadesarchaea archaeon]
MKEKLAIVIAVLMITSMAFVISTTTVSAPSTFSASPGATVSPTSARANTRIKFTITVTNDYAADNIDNVILIASGFAQPIGYSGSLVVAGDNIENAVAHLRQAGENLKKAEDNKKSAGTNVKYAGDNLQAPTQDDWRGAAVTGGGASAEADDAWVYVENAGSNLVKAASEIDNQVEDLDYIYTTLYNAGTDLVNAAGTGATNIENFDADGADNVRQAGENLRTAAGSIRFGDLETAGLRLLDAATNLIAAGASLDDLDAELSAIGSAGSALQTAGNKLVDAGNFLDNAGYALGVAENYLTSAGENLYGSSTHLQTAGTKLKIAASYIENAGIALEDNIPRAGENLKLAAENLENLAGEIGVALGLDEENAAATDLKQAADNLRTSGKVDITTAGNELISMASNLSSAGSKMESTARDLQPTTWTINTITNGLRFDAIGDNIIAPGGSRTFVFLWTTPNIATKADYMTSVLVSKEEPIYTTYENLGGFTITIDGKKPTLVINVTQVGVTAVNVAGTALDSAKATITITASETLLSLDNVYVENSGGSAENFLPPITMTTTDNIVYTGTFTVENWDDNVVVVRVSKVKDLAGNENTAGMENTVTVDTRAPIFVDNGLAALLVGVRDNVAQAGTGTIYRYVDNSASENLVILVEDNALGQADNASWVTSVTIDTTAANRDPMFENRWTKSITLSQGLNSIVKVTATDRTGNSESDNVENIFIDTKPPTIEFTSVAGKTWDENGELISDNTPEIKITVTDPGYPTSGLGVARENLVVEVSSIENFDASVSGTWFQRALENKVAWNPTTGVFENLIDNAGKGLKDGTYYVRVYASDNLIHNGRENENAKRSFTIDTIKPVKDTDIVVSDKISGTIDNPNVYKVADRTIEGTVTSGEVGGTIKVYFNGVHQPTYDLVTTTTTWSRTVTLPAGQTTKIELTLTDKAGNESSKVLYGYAMPDATAPTVTITAPTTDLSTDAMSIILEATVTKDTWEEYSELTVRIDATSLTAPLTATNVLSTDGKLTRAVELVEGTNTISVSAQDVAGNWSTVKTVTITRTVTPWATYAIIIVIVALILAAIAIFRKR